MKKNMIVLSIIFALLASAITGIHAVEVAQAQFFGQPIVWTDSPSSTVVYTNTSIPLDVYAVVHVVCINIVRPVAFPPCFGLSKGFIRSCYLD